LSLFFQDREKGSTEGVLFHFCLMKLPAGQWFRVENIFQTRLWMSLQCCIKINRVAAPPVEL
jgi:hypothetical protein